MVWKSLRARMTGAVPSNEYLKANLQEFWSMTVSECLDLFAVVHVIMYYC